MAEYKTYKPKGLTHATPWTSSIDMTGVSVSDKDKKDGSPKTGDMIAMNPKNPGDRWLIAQAYFEENLELTN